MLALTFDLLDCGRRLQCALVFSCPGFHKVGCLIVLTRMRFSGMSPLEEQRGFTSSFLGPKLSNRLFPMLPRQELMRKALPDIIHVTMFLITL